VSESGEERGSKKEDKALKHHPRRLLLWWWLRKLAIFYGLLKEASSKEARDRELLATANILANVN